MSFNFVTEIIKVVAASLGFVLSLALNDALKTSFDAMLAPDNLEEGDLQAKWSYAACAVIFVLICLYLLMACLQPKVAQSSLGCAHPWSWLVPLVGVILLLVIILPQALSRS